MPDPLVLVQLTDLHLSAEPGTRIQGVDADAGLHAVISHLARGPRPDAVLLSGDLSHDGSRASYKRVAESVGTIGTATMALPGNHDDPAMLRAVLGDAGIATGATQLLGDWLLVLLDSTVPDAVPGRLATAELETLAQALKAHPDRHALVCLHHQPVDVGTTWIDLLGLQNPQALFTVLDQSPAVRALAFGHIHAECDLQRNSLRLLGSPSTACQFRPGTATVELDDRPPGYRRITLSADGTIDTRAEYVAPLA